MSAPRGLMTNSSICDQELNLLFKFLDSVIPHPANRDQQLEKTRATVEAFLTFIKGKEQGLLSFIKQHV